MPYGIAGMFEHAKIRLTYLYAANMYMNLHMRERMNMQILDRLYLYL